MLHLRSLLLISAMVCVRGIAPAADEPTIDGADKVAIEKLYDRYLQAFVTQDYALIRECIQAPFVVFSQGEMRAFESTDAVISFFRTQRQALDQRGYLRAEILKSQVTPLSAKSALINKSYRRFKKDGTFLEDGAAIYPVSKSSGVWKLRGLIPQEPKHFGKVY